VCGQHRYREDAAIWAFRETNRIATINWDKTRTIIEPEIAAYERNMMASNAMVEAQAAALLKEGKKEDVTELLNKHTSSFAASVMARWRELKGKMWEIFIRSM
jgi:dipeptidase